MKCMQNKLIAGNWKMNKGGSDGIELIGEILSLLPHTHDVDVLVAPPFTAIAAVAHEIASAHAHIHVAAQNMHEKPSGAFTGEISVNMLKESGAGWVILGHSERRHVFGENSSCIDLKLNFAVENNIRPIFCVGETLEQRESGESNHSVALQLKASMATFQKSPPGFIYIAYEPVWAIGTGKVASPKDAQDMHVWIRHVLKEFSEDLAKSTKILYGGSVKQESAQFLLEQPDVDGLLVGGASLDAKEFVGIVKTAVSLVGK